MSPKKRVQSESLSKLGKSTNTKMAKVVRNSTKSRSNQGLDEPISCLSEKTAGLRMYETQDIMYLIYNLIGRRDLLTMLRINKGGMGGAAAVLYRTINVDRIPKITKRSARQELYCNSVRVLDISPRQKLIKFVASSRRRKDPIIPSRFPRAANLTSEPAPDPYAFNPTALLSDYKSWRTIFPNLHTISNNFPKVDGADAYIAHFDGEAISVALRHNIMVEAHFRDEKPSVQGFYLPDKPHHPNVTVFRHTIGVNISGIQMDEEYMEKGFLYDHGGPKRVEARQKWVASVIDNPGLDKRITHVSISRSKVIKSSLTVDEMMDFLRLRRSGTCEALEMVALPPVHLHLLRILSGTHLLGSNLTSLTCTIVIDPTPNLSPDDAGQEKLRNAQPEISSIDRACPSLSHLTVTFRYDDHRSIKSNVEPLQGLRNVRLLTTHFRPLQDPSITARHISGLGADDCVYYQPDLRSAVYMEDFNRIAKACRASTSAIIKRDKKALLVSLGIDWPSAFWKGDSAARRRGLHVEYTDGPEQITRLVYEAEEIQTRQRKLNQ